MQYLVPLHRVRRVCRRSKAGLHKWAAEVAAQGSFSAPFSPDDAGASLGGLPVPHLLIGTKADMTGECQDHGQDHKCRFCTCPRVWGSRQG